MPAPVVNPHDGDDLLASSITTNVTDKIVAWGSSHESGLTTNGALRHQSDQIDDAALTELTAPSNTAQTSGAGVHARLDMIAAVLSAIMGTSGTGYAAKYGQLGSLAYGTLNAISTALSSGASSAAGASTLVRRASDGSANFSGTVGVVALSGTGNWATTGSVSSVNVTASGVIIAGTGARQITTADGHLDANQLTGAIGTAAMPALSGDVTNAAGSVVMTVSSVGGKTAAQIASATTSVLAASSSGVGNHGAIAKYDASGGMTFDSTVTAPLFSGPASAVAAGAVTAAGIANYAITRQQVSDGSVTAQATPNKTVQVAPYYYYNSANLYGTPPGTSPAIDAANLLPSAGQQRYDLLYTDDSYSLGWLAGVPSSSSPAKPSLAVGSTARPLAWAGPITNATTAITAGMIFDARPSITSGGGSGSGGGGGLPTNVPIVTVGSDPTATLETDIYDLTAGRLTGTRNTRDLSKWWTNFKNLYTEDPATVANAPSLSSLLAHGLGGLEQHPRSFITFSGNSVTLLPVALMFPSGLTKINPSPFTVTVGSPGAYTPYYVVADYTGRTDGTFIITVTSNLPPLSTSQMLLAVILNSGNTFLADPYVDWAPIMDVTSTQMRPITDGYAGDPLQTIGAAGVVTPPTEVTAATLTLPFPRNMTLTVEGHVRISASASAAGGAQMTVDGIPLGRLSNFGTGMPVPWDTEVAIGGPRGTSRDGLSLGAGIHTVRLMVNPYFSGQIVTVQSVTWHSIQWGV